MEESNEYGFEDSVEEIIEGSDLDPNVERIKAAATLVVTAVINILNVYGYAVDAGPWINLLSSVLAFGSILYAWWKNQNVTNAAVAGQAVLNRIKRGKHAADDKVA